MSIFFTKTAALSLLLLSAAAYHLLTDQQLHPEIMPLAEHAGNKVPTVNNYYIRAMALSEYNSEPALLLQHYFAAAKPSMFTGRPRLPELPSLENLYLQPLFCDLGAAECRVRLAQQPAELTQLLTQFAPLLAQYEALQQLTELSPIDESNISLNWAALLQLEQLFALQLYQLILQQDYLVVEDKLARHISQQRQFIRQPASSLLPLLFVSSAEQFYLPLAMALKKHHPEPLDKLAAALAPLSLAELTAIESKRYQFATAVQTVQEVNLAWVAGTDNRLLLKLLYKPNLTLNSLYQQSQLPQLTAIQTKGQWYQYVQAELALEPDEAPAVPNTLTMLRQHYRNFAGGQILQVLTTLRDHDYQARIELDSKLHLLQPLLLKAPGALEPTDFATNPYNGSSASYHDRKWCYTLINAVCLALPGVTKENSKMQAPVL